MLLLNEILLVRTHIMLNQIFDSHYIQKIYDLIHKRADILGIVGKANRKVMFLMKGKAKPTKVKKSMMNVIVSEGHCYYY